MITEIARVPNCLTLSTKFPKEPNKEEREGHGFGTKSIYLDFHTKIARIDTNKTTRTRRIGKVRSVWIDGTRFGFKEELYNKIMEINSNKYKKGRKNWE